ncbi:MAG: hypothetical protein R3B54_17310, partial [Bdellovibrionota bacterium]
AMIQQEAGQDVLRKLLIKAANYKGDDHPNPARNIIPLLTIDSWRHPDLEGILMKLLTNAGIGNRREIARTVFENIDKIPRRQIRNLPLFIAQAIKANDKDAFFDGMVIAARAAEHLNLGVGQRAEWMSGVDYQAAKQFSFNTENMDVWQQRFLELFYPASQESLKYHLFSANYGDLTPKHLQSAIEFIEYLERQNLAEKERKKFLDILSHLAAEEMLPDEMRSTVDNFLKTRRSKGLLRKCVDAAYSAFQ